MLLRIGLIKFFGLTWKDAVGWMLTLACFQRSPWLPLSDHTGPSEVVWPFCFRKAFSVPAWGRETVTHTGQYTNAQTWSQTYKNTVLSVVSNPQAGDSWWALAYMLLYCENNINWQKSEIAIIEFYMVQQYRLFLLEITWFVCPHSSL